MWTFSGQVNFEFFEIYGISARTRSGKGVEPVRTFFEKGRRGQVFAILCGSPLWRAPKVKQKLTHLDFI